MGTKKRFLTKNSSPVQRDDIQTPPATQDKNLRIFISHKHQDGICAETIKKELEIYGGGRLEFFLSEDISFGQQWNDEIHDALRKADWLFLLYSDPTSEWDWCLYESGFFAAKAKAMQEEQNQKAPLICLHNPELTPPGPLQSWQSVKATREDLVKLLKELFCEPPRAGVEPINPILSDASSTLDMLADRIAKLIGPAPTSRDYTRGLTVTLDSQQLEQLQMRGQAPSAAIVEANASSLQMFGLDIPTDSRQWTWGDLANQLQEPGQKVWMSNLERLMLDAIESRALSPSLPIFYTSGHQKQYLPVLHRVDRLRDLSHQFHVLFIDSPSEDDLYSTGVIGQIVSILRMARKFRFGVVDHFRKRIKTLKYQKAGDEEVGDLLHQLVSMIQRIESEAAQEGFLDDDGVSQLFEAQEDQDAVIESFVQWSRLRDRLMMAIETKDLDGLYGILGEIRLLNKDFMVMASRRYHELLQAD